MKKNKKTYQGTSTLEVLEGADNYNRWIAERIKAAAEFPALELGAGTGNISEYFLRTKGFTITEVDLELLRLLRKRFAKKCKIGKFDLGHRPSNTLHYKYKTVFAVNVFEHIKDDVAAMRNCKPLFKKKGRLIILVPAKKFAYTKLDKNLGHHRRYEPDELSQKLKQAGYTVESVKYFNMAGLLSWMVRDRIEKQHLQLDKSQIELFDKVVPVLKRIEDVVPIPVGISLIAVAKYE